ncbi:phage minor structural protein [Clostridium sp. CAG:81]|jgi:hypothetical protein|nr:phage minor structural protein [Clostridium sp. CAG:81]
MAVFTSDSVDRLNSIEDRKIRAYLYKLNEDLTYMFNNLTPEDNYSELARLVYVADRENVARLEVRADGIELEVSRNSSQIANLSVQAGQISAKVTDVANNYNSSMNLLANMFSLSVNTPSGSSSAVLTGDRIALTTGHFTIDAKNLKVDASGNATFAGDLEGATLTGCDIVGGSLSIANGTLYADSGWVKFGDFTVSTNNAYKMYSGDGSFEITTAKSPGGSVAAVIVGTSVNQTEIEGGNITSTGALNIPVVYATTGKHVSEFYDIQLSKSWWKGWTITETVQDLWDQVDSLSDATAKENVYNIDADEALQFLLDTRTVTFQYKSDGKWSAGVIAQEVDALQDRLEIYYPLVRLDKRSQKYRVDYKNYIPLLIAAVQNLQRQITALKGVN